MTWSGALAVLLLAASLSRVDGGIHCYQCAALAGAIDSDTSPLCTHFDGSPPFQVYCQFSTLCMKRTTKYKVRNETSVIVQRGCAPQKYTLQTFNEQELRWQRKDQIDEDAYTPGCFVDEDNGSPSSPPERCYCAYHLCNGKSSVISSIDHYGAIVLGIFIIELTCVQGILAALL